MPGATVVLTNNATNQTLTMISGENGSYRFSLLAPGAYRVSFSAPGFKTSQVPSIAVNVSEDPTLDASLERGNPRERVACNCRLSLSASSSGTLVDHKTITGVPLTTRNFAQVLSMSSGTAADVNNAGTLGRGTQTVNVNGSTTAGSYTIDGAYAPSTVPNPDTIAEFKIQTSQYDAGYGALVPSTNVITRGGESQFHGTAWEFVRNDIFNANAFFRNATGQPKPNLKQNQFGVTLGGPVLRDKWFFFGSYQGTRQVNGLDPTSVATVILPPLTSDRSAAALAAQFCPANHLLTSGADAGQPDPRYLTFAGGKQLDCANQNTATTVPINPVALSILQTKLPDGSYLIPVPQTILPSGSNAGMGFSSFSFPSYYNEDHFVANSDYVASPVNTLSWRGFFSRINQRRSLGAPGGATVTPVIPGAGSPQALHAQDDALSFKLTSVLTTKVANEARFAYTRTFQMARGVGTPSADSFGMTPVDPLFPLPPEVTMLGPMGTFRFFGNGANDFWTLTNTFAWTDNLSLVHGRHNARVGGVFLMQYNDRLDTGAARGKITFETFEDLLVGLSAADNQSPGGRSNIETVRANEGVGPNGEVQYQYRHYYGAAFAQDDFKVTPRLDAQCRPALGVCGPLVRQGRHDRERLAVSVEASAHSAALGNSGRRCGCGELQSGPDQSVHGRAVRSAAHGCMDRSHPQFLSEQHAAGEVRPPVWFCVAAVRSRRARRGARRVRLVLPGAGFQRQRRKCSPVHRGAVCAGIHQYGRQQWPVGSPEAVSDHHARLCCAHADLPAF